jgi:hypothetical protein
MGDDARSRKKLVVPVVLAVVLLVDAGRSALSQQAQSDARVADAGVSPDARMGPEPPPEEEGCGCPGVD